MVSSRDPFQRLLVASNYGPLLMMKPKCWLKHHQIFKKQISKKTKAFIFPKSGQGVHSKNTWKNQNSPLPGDSKWPFYPLVVGHQTTFGGVTFSPSQKSHKQNCQVLVVLFHSLKPRNSWNVQFSVKAPPHFKFFSAQRNDEHLVKKINHA